MDSGMKIALMEDRTEILYGISNNHMAIRNCTVILPVDKSPIKIIRVNGLADDEIIYNTIDNTIMVHPNNRDFVIK